MLLLLACTFALQWLNHQSDLEKNVILYSCFFFPPGTYGTLFINVHHAFASEHHSSLVAQLVLKMTRRDSGEKPASGSGHDRNSYDDYEAIYLAWLIWTWFVYMVTMKFGMMIYLPVKSGDVPQLPWTTRGTIFLGGMARPGYLSLSENRLALNPLVNHHYHSLSIFQQPQKTPDFKIHSPWSIWRNHEKPEILWALGRPWKHLNSQKDPGSDAIEAGHFRSIYNASSVFKCHQFIHQPEVAAVAAVNLRILGI